MELLENLLADCIGGLDLGPVVQVKPDLTIGATIQAMRSAGRGCALVESSGRLVGLFTERDVLTRVLIKDVSLDDPITAVATQDPITVTAEDSIATALRKMRGGDFRHLPLVDQGDKIKGVVSIKDIVCYLVEHFPQSIYNLPPDASQIQTQREGA
ncbi:MAG: cyclic nucleotide-binding/CBS domain-containing protein [Phycisphaerae bacterium]